MIGDETVELARLGFWFDAEVACEKRDAGFVLSERRPAPARLGIEAHERAVNGLVEWVECQQAGRNLERGVGVRLAHVVREQRLQSRDSERSKSLTLGA
jgi:hypothetical protein